MPTPARRTGRTWHLGARTAAMSTATVALTSLGTMLAAAPAATAATGPTIYNDCMVTVNGLDLQTATIPQLQAAMTAGRLTSRQLTQAYLDRIAAYDHGSVQLNTIRTLTDGPLAQADAADAARSRGVSGPMLGIPVLLKDNVGTLDADTTAGSIALAGNRPRRDASVTAQLRSAGAVILGKTNLSEFANWMSRTMPNGFSSLGGQVLNPYTQGDPSGSSSGSGAGGTMAFAAATIGSETSGSILSPSTANSMVGIKPTVGLVSRTGVIPLAHSFDTAGPIARDVTDAASMLSATSALDSTDAVNMPAPGSRPAGHDYTPFLTAGSLRGKTIGYDTGAVPSGAAGGLFTQALAALQAAGATVVATTSNFANTSTLSLTEIGGIPSEFKYGIGHYLATEAGPSGGTGRPALVTDDLTGIIAYNQQHSDRIPYGQNLLMASDATAGATPDDPSSTATITGARATIDSAISAGHLDAIVGPDARYAGVGAAAGYPSITVPDGYTTAAIGSTPHGLQFLGTPYSEPTLIGMAYGYEQATHLRVPPTVSDPAITRGACPSAAAPTMPEAPLAVALPALALLGCGAMLATRRRRTQR